MELLGIIPVTYLEMSGIFPHSSKLCVVGLSSQEEIHLQGNTESVKLNFEPCLPPSMSGTSCWETSKQGRVNSLSGQIGPSHQDEAGELFQAGGRENTWASRWYTGASLSYSLPSLVRKWTAAANVSWKRQGWLGALPFQWWGFESFYQINSILKSRSITLPTKVHLVKAMVFPVVMDGCESWIIKKAEHRRIDAFELWCWRRLLRVPWTARRSN